jgi:hypothetical protein
MSRKRTSSLARSSLWSGVFLGLTLLPLFPAEPEYSFKKLAALGDPSFGDAAERFTNNFQANSINSHGEVLFGTHLTRDGEGVFFLDTGGEGKLIARFDDPAPGGDRYRNFFLGPTSLNDRGDAAMVFDVQGPGVLGPGGPVPSRLFHVETATGVVTPLVGPGDPSPCGGTFIRVEGHAIINNHGDIVFKAFLQDPALPPGTPPAGRDEVGAALFRVNIERPGEIECVLKVGDPGPEGTGTTFDHFNNPFINDSGDIVFGGHLKEDFCIEISVEDLPCADSLFLRKAGGEVIALARQGTGAPGGGSYRIAFGGVANARGEVCFIGDLTPEPEPLFRSLGVFLYRDGEVMPIARPGDTLPGGVMATAAPFPTAAWINRPGEVAFVASHESTPDGPGICPENQDPDHGLYVWSEGRIRLVVRSGDVIPDLGVVAAFLPPDYLCEEVPWPGTGTPTNESGQILFTAVLADRSGVLLVATPAAPVGATFRRGDANASGTLELTDAIVVLGYLFLGSERPACADAADANDNGTLELTDAIFILNYLFLGSRPPPPPGPNACGVDPTPEEPELGCDVSCA